MQTIPTLVLSKMVPVSNNNDIEESRGRDQGVEAALPPPTEIEMATNHPEEPEAEEPFRRTNRYLFSRSRALTALLAAAGVGAAVGTASVVFRAASGNPSTITSNKQVANVLLAPDGYEQVGNLGDGLCADANSNSHPYATFFSLFAVGDCADKCNECVATAFTTSFVGMAYNPTTQTCTCMVSQTGTIVDFSQINCIGGCKYNAAAPSNTGTGPIAGTVPFSGWTCYRFVGGGSKASKTPKAPKRG